QIAARRRRRNYRADLQGARQQAWLWFGCLGLADGLSRDNCVVSLRAPLSSPGGKDREQAGKQGEPHEDSILAHSHFRRRAAFVIGRGSAWEGGGPAGAAQSG